MRIVSFVPFCWLFISGATLAQDVQVRHETAVDFSRYATFAWTVNKSLPLAFPAIPPEEAVDAAAVDAEIRRETEKRFKSIGLQEQAEAELLISYSGIVRFRLDSGVKRGDRARVRDGDWRRAAGRPDHYLTMEGILNVEVVDAGTDQVVWQASAIDEVDKPKDTVKRFGRLTKKAWEKFPPEK